MAKQPTKEKKPRAPKPKGPPKAKEATPRPAWVVPWEESTASEVFERFALKNKYSRGDSDLSITQLISPPRIVALEKIYADEIKKEESTSILAILGSAVHRILEDGAPENFVTERRVFTEIDGIKISGQMDAIVKDIGAGVVDIEDYKVTSMWSITDGPPQAWIKQLNGYAALLRRVYGVKVRSLRAHAVLRDYSKQRAPSWMDRPVVTLDIPMWEPSGQDAYLEQQVARHKQAQVDALAGKDLPECTPFDTWDSEAAIHHYSTAFDYLMDNPVRCHNYCAVAHRCGQYKAWQVGFTLSTELARQEAAKSSPAPGNPAPTSAVLPVW